MATLTATTLTTDGNELTISPELQAEVLSFVTATYESLIFEMLKVRAVEAELELVVGDSGYIDGSYLNSVDEDLYQQVRVEFGVRGFTRDDETAMNYDICEAKNEVDFAEIVAKARAINEAAQAA